MLKQPLLHPHFLQIPATGVTFVNIYTCGSVVFNSEMIRDIKQRADLYDIAKVKPESLTKHFFFLIAVTSCMSFLAAVCCN